MTAHSMISPSSAHRWVKCTGSIRHAALRPLPDDSEDAAEGTAAHWVLAQTLAGLPLEDTDPAGTPVTQEMLDGAVMALEVLAPYYGPDLKSEQWVGMSRRIAPECFGTLDLAHMDMSTYTLRIWDYKFGWEPVEVRNNWQLIAYAAGMFEGMNLDGLQDQALRVELSIIQPRPWHRDGKVRTWTVTASDLRGPINQLSNAANEGLRGNPKYQAGVHCRRCPCRHDCPALQADAGSWADMAARPDLALEAPPEQQGRELATLEAAVEMIKARASGLRAAIGEHIKAGRSVPGWGMVPHKGRIAWSLPDDAVIELGAACGVDLVKPSVLTPTQAKAKGISPEILASATHQPEAMVLEQITTTDLQRIFNHGRK